MTLTIKMPSFKTTLFACARKAEKLAAVAATKTKTIRKEYHAYKKGIKGQ